MGRSVDGTACGTIKMTESGAQRYSRAGSPFTHSSAAWYALGIRLSTGTQRWMEAPSGS